MSHIQKTLIVRNFIKGYPNKKFFNFFSHKIYWNRIHLYDMESNTLSMDFEEESQLQHSGKRIDRMIVSLDMNYVVTYSKDDDNSISGWLIDIEKDGQQHVDVNFNLVPYEISSFVLYKKILIFYYNNTYGKYLLWIIIQLKYNFISN